MVNINYLPGIFTVTYISTLFTCVKPLYFGENSKAILCFESELESRPDETRDNKLEDRYMKLICIKEHSAHWGSILTIGSKYDSVITQNKYTIVTDNKNIGIITH
jgi:hypothetical protein